MNSDLTSSSSRTHKSTNPKKHTNLENQTQEYKKIKPEKNHK